MYSLVRASLVTTCPWRPAHFGTKRAPNSGTKAGAPAVRQAVRIGSFDGWSDSEQPCRVRCRRVGPRRSGPACAPPPRTPREALSRRLRLAAGRGSSRLVPGLLRWRGLVDLCGLTGTPAPQSVGVTRVPHVEPQNSISGRLARSASVVAPQPGTFAGTPPFVLLCSVLL